MVDWAASICRVCRNENGRWIVEQCAKKKSVSYAQTKTATGKCIKTSMPASMTNLLNNIRTKHNAPILYHEVPLERCLSLSVIRYLVLVG